MEWKEPWHKSWRFQGGKMSKALSPFFFTAPYLLSSSLPWRKKSKLLCAAAAPPVRFLLCTKDMPYLG